MSFFNLKWLILALFLWTNCSDDDVEINNVSDYESYIQDEMEDQNIPAMSILVFRESEVLYEKYLGQSDLEQNLALANNHMFLLASVSKVITGTALLQLYEDGLFDLDDPINDYLPYTVMVPNQNTPITFRMLLTHTSGIADNDPVLDEHYYYNQDSPIALGDFIENYLKQGGTYYNKNDNFHDFEPGTQYEYSNIGSATIGALVEEISGKDFNTYCKENIFQPLGMTNTAWRLDEITQTIVTPYDYINGQNQSIRQYTNTDYPNGGLRSTTRDLHKFFLAFVRDGRSNNVQLLEAATIQAMRSAQIPAIDSEVGLHLFQMDAANKLWGHDGGEQGVATIAAFNSDTKVGVIVLCNQGEADLDEIMIETYKYGLTL